MHGLEFKGLVFQPRHRVPLEQGDHVRLYDSLDPYLASYEWVVIASTPMGKVIVEEILARREKRILKTELVCKVLPPPAIPMTGG